MASLPQRHSCNISALYNPPLSCNIIHNHYIHLHTGDESGQYFQLCTTDPLWPRNYYLVVLKKSFPPVTPNKQKIKTKNQTKITSKSLAEQTE